MESPRAPGAGAAEALVPFGSGDRANSESGPENQFTICWFDTGKPKGPAYGFPFHVTWSEFTAAFHDRREGSKDGGNFIPARFKLEGDGQRVRRKAANLIARTAIAMDIESSKKTGEIPPDLGAAVEIVQREGWAAVVYTSHNHSAAAPRYRVVVPLSEEIDYELPAVQVIARRLGLDGVLDTSKVGAASLFYMPSCESGKRDCHSTVVVTGAPVDAAWVREAAGEMLAAQLAEQERIEAEARALAELRRAELGEDSVIARVRDKLDPLAKILRKHGYDQRGPNFRHPDSKSGSFGANIKILGGIERVYSHNAGDPLHRDNLPKWCGGVTAVDAVDVTIILDHQGDRDKGLKALADKFFPPKSDERRTLTALILGLVRVGVEDVEIQATAFAEGARLGLSEDEVCSVARHAYNLIIREARTAQ
jgi:hypothetical protein